MSYISRSTSKNCTSVRLLFRVGKLDLGVNLEDDLEPAGMVAHSAYAHSVHVTMHLCPGGTIRAALKQGLWPGRQGLGLAVPQS